jgi:exosortase A
MTAVLPIVGARPLTGEGWRTHLVALGAAIAGLLLLLARDTGGMVSIWWNSDTFNHCFLIPPVIGWLVWQRLPELRRLAPAAWAPGLVLVAAGASLWVLGEAGGLALARHLALVLMLQGAIIACLGPCVSRALAFPLFYLLFLVPVGEELVPVMQTVTADMSMALLAISGVPAHIEGIFISTPTGYFEVAEACSGVKFLVAMAAYGALVANVCFRSWPRRIGFMAASIVIPILANGVRAWGTIFIAHHTSIDFAVGMDHVFYGWVFFAIVIALLMAAGWPFFDRTPSDPWFDPEPLLRPAGAPRRAVQIAAAAVAIAAVPPIWTAAVASTGEQAPSASFALPDVPGWTKSTATGRRWQPHFAGADLLRVERYRNAQGQEVDLGVAVFARQEEGKELVGYGQGAAAPDGDWAWTADAPAPAQGKAERIASNGLEREVVSFYRVGSVLTGSPAAVKLETVKVRLLGGPQRAAAVLVSAPAPAPGVSPRPAINAFLSSLGDPAALADRASGLPSAN